LPQQPLNPLLVGGPACLAQGTAHLRAFVKTDWAQLVQRVISAVLHYHPSGVEEQAALWWSLAEDLELNVPAALALGYLAVRSQPSAAADVSAHVPADA
jgi:hypothetical protein